MNKKLILLLFLVLGVIFLSRKQEKKETKEEETRGVFISYIEISKYLKEKEEETSKNNIIEMINNCKDFGLNTLILQVRPSSDAMYDSKIFPLSKYLTETDSYPYDVLSFFLDEAHKKDMKLIAWINPYRIATTGTREEIKENSPAYPYKDTDIVYEGNGIFWNPAAKETEEIIVEGIKEVLEYPVDGILFDDYFYPNDEIDQKELEEYRKNYQNISEEEYHRMIINQMVKRVHTVCREKNVLFGISPEGNIENNYEQNHADVRAWLEEKDYIDFIMPQLYYGFHNSAKPFYETAKEWDALNKNEIPLYTALAFYKVGKFDQYAREGKEEWINNRNIIQREIIHARNLKTYKGFILYRYDNVFSEEEATMNSKQEKENVKKLIS